MKSQAANLENYLTDASNMAGGRAERLCVPRSEDEVAEILREANEKGVPVTISGARTGTVGGAIPFGGWVVSLEKLNNIVGIDRRSKTVVVEPGVILGDLQKAVDAEGLFYPPDPTEWSCQIGGTVATNASGARSFRYGATREYVDRIKVVLADGDTVTLRRGNFVADVHGRVVVRTDVGREVVFAAPTYGRPKVRKNVSGYYNTAPLDALDVFIGSEGTLGVVTEIELRLLGKPEGTFSGIVFFPDDADLLAFVDEARSRSLMHRAAGAAVHSGVEPASMEPVIATLIEYFDSNALRFIGERFPETPSGMSGAIFFEQETTAEEEERIVAAWNELLEGHNADIDRSWFATSEQDRERMRAFRHALPVAVNEFIARHKQRKVGTDMSVPDERFAGFLRFYKQTLDASGIDHVIFGHIGDCHLHANVLPRDEREAEKARHIYGRCIAQAIMLGGCVSAEHGIGKLKRKYLAAMMGERYLSEMAAVKRAFDPKGILGRGNMFDETYL